jgi:RimJ/RimL family protein N-acetyltransferase
MRTEWWPFFALRIRTPRLELRPPTDDDLDELGELLTAGVHDPARMPFNTPWTDAEQPELQRSALQFHWRTRASLTVDDWHVPFGVWQDGRLVGQQDVAAAQFRLLRTVNTGSWVGLGHQGGGIGKEMRAAVLHLAFAGLGAIRAETAAFEDNAASLAVTRSLGYRPNGDDVRPQRDRAGRQLRFTLSNEEWELRRRHDIEIDGLAACAPLLGVEPPDPEA